MKQYIDKDLIIAEIEKKIEYCAKQRENMLNVQYYTLASDMNERMGELNYIKEFINTLEVKEINTWHLQKNEDINDYIKDWSLYSFICLMNDGSIQKFTGIRCECADGSINVHVDSVDDKYDTDDIIFWIETPL